MSVQEVQQGLAAGAEAVGAFVTAENRIYLRSMGFADKVGAAVTEVDSLRQTVPRFQEHLNESVATQQTGLERLDASIAGLSSMGEGSETVSDAVAKLRGVHTTIQDEALPAISAFSGELDEVVRQLDEIHTRLGDLVTRARGVQEISDNAASLAIDVQTDIINYSRQIGK